MKYSFVTGNLKTKFPTNVEQRMLNLLKHTCDIATYRSSRLYVPNITSQIQTNNRIWHVFYLYLKVSRDQISVIISIMLMPYLLAPI